MRLVLLAALPFVVLVAAIVVVMLMIAVRRGHRAIATATLIGLLASLAAILAAPAAPVAVTALFLVDGFTRFFVALLLVATIAVALLSYTYLEGTEDGPYEEYYLLLLLATIGATALVASVQFAAFFLGLETLSIALIGLIAYPRGRDRAVEAGLKYLVLAGISSAFMLFGIALIYFTFGTMTFASLGQLWSKAPNGTALYADTGFAMLLTGIGFKLSVVPFHMWAPDIYEGAPAPVTGYVAVVSKIAVFGLLLRYFVLMDGYRDPTLLRVIALISILSMLVGNLLALLQENVKRILAYSSIAHLGYVLVALLADSVIGLDAVAYYLAAYAVMTIGAFGVVTLMSEPGRGGDADQLSAYRGLMWTRPWLAGAFTAILLALAGIPPTMGFIAKVYVMTSGVGTSLVWPLAALVIGSVLGLYYYLRVIVMLFLPAAGVEYPLMNTRQSWVGGITLGALVVLLMVFGAYPATLISAAHVATTSLTLLDNHIHTAANIQPP